MGKIAFFELEKWEEEYVRKNLKGFKLKFFPETLSAENAKSASDCDAVAIFIYSKINAKILEKLPKLKMIATMSTGFDHIDLKECKNRKILVCNVPSYGENTVAEHTFALILALSRKIPESIERTKKADFSLSGLRGFDLKGKTIGVIGTGKIGRHVVRIAKGFEMNILACDERKDVKFAKEYGFSYVPLATLLKKSDIISLHIPLTKETHHLINSRNINLIEKGAILFNTSRGGLIDTDALCSALDSGILKGAALDVLEEEGFIKEEKQLLSRAFPSEANLKTILKDHILLQKENVLITPHNAFNSSEALQRILDVTVSNAKSFFSKKPQNLVVVPK